MIADAARVFSSHSENHRGFSSPSPSVRFAVLHKGVTERAIISKTDWTCSIFSSVQRPWKCSCWCVITRDAEHFSGEAGGECFLLQGSLSRYAYALRFIGILLPSAQKLHYEQQHRQNVLCLCPCWAHKRTLNWVIQWQVCKDVTDVLEQGDTLALQKSALWVNNAPCYQFGHAAKVNVKTHWSTHSSAFAAAYQAAARRQVSFLHGNNHRNRAADKDDPGQICRYVWKAGRQHGSELFITCHGNARSWQAEQQAARQRNMEKSTKTTKNNQKTNSPCGLHSTRIFCFPVIKRSRHQKPDLKKMQQISSGAESKFLNALTFWGWSSCSVIADQLT